MRKDINKMEKEYIIAVCTVLLILIILWDIFDKKLFPWIVNKKTKNIEKNPKWIMSKINHQYGFLDIDFILVESPLGLIPRFRASKDGTRLEMLIDKDTTTNDVDNLLRVALVAKIKMNYGLWYPNKSLHWLSILLYMLDGGNIEE